MPKIIFGLIIIAIILFIWFSRLPEKTKDKIVSTPAAVYAKSTGVYDGPAATALNKINSLARPSADDHALAGNIISEAILEGETPIRGTGRQLTMMAANNYGAALADPANLTPYYIDDADQFNHRLRARLGDEIMGNPDNYDELAGMFDDGGINFMNNMFPAGEMEGDPVVRMMFNLEGDINIARQVSSKAIKDQQKDISESAGEAAANYIEAVKTHHNDTQNAHDTNVSREIRNTLDIIEGDLKNMDNLVNAGKMSVDEMKRLRDFNINDIKKFINSAKISPNKKAKATTALAAIQSRNENVFAANRREMDVIRLVWLRSIHPDNNDNRDNIQEAVLDALIDINGGNAYGETHTVCANGRISRIVGALSALDVNPAVGNLNTAEQVNNYVLDQSAKLWNDYIAECKKNDLAKVANAFDTPDGPEEDGDLIRFKAELKKRVDKMLADNMADDSVRQKVYIGFDL